MPALSAFQDRLTGSRYGASLLSGALLGISFPSYPFIRLELLTWIALVPMLLGLQKETGPGEFFRRTWLAMLLFCIISLWWVSLATLPGGVLTILWQSLCMVVPLAAFYLIRRKAGYRFALFSLPFIWVAWEWAYMQQDLSLGWLTLGNSQANLSWMIQYADVTGVWGVSFWLVCFNVLAVLAITGPRRDSLRAVTLMALMIAVPLLYSLVIFQRESAVLPKGQPQLRVTLVQPDIDPHEKWGRSSNADMMESYRRLTSRAVQQDRPELILWPETAIPFYILDAPYADELASLRLSLRKWDTPLLTGFSDIVRFPATAQPASGTPGKYDRMRMQPFETYNASMLLEPGGSAPQVYRKMRLVPFAERVPYVEYFPWLGAFNFSLAGISSWGKGQESSVMELRSSRNGRVVTANIICYESIFPALVTEFVRKGAGFLTLVTNDGWYGLSYGPYQHLAIAKLRCIENRRAMARCANTGLTVFIDKFGRVFAEIPWWQEGTLTAEVPLESRLSCYTRNPDLLPKAASVISLLIFIVVAFTRKKNFKGKELP